MRRGLLVVGLVCVAGGVALWVVTRSWFIAARVEPVLAELLGGEVTIGRVVYGGQGAFEFRDVVLRVAGMPGPGGEVCRFGRAKVVADVKSLLAAGPAEIRSVVLEDLRIRFSEDQVAPGRFNFMQLDPRWTTRAEGGPILPPRIQIARAVVEMGEHNGAAYERLGERVLSGSLAPAENKYGWHDFELSEIGDEEDAAVQGPIVVTGQWNAATNEHDLTIQRVMLDERAFGMCPYVARQWWEQMNLEGDVSAIRVEWDRESQYSIRGNVEDISLTIPVGAADLWARYRDGTIEDVKSRPRMHVRSGEIAITRDTVGLHNLRGELLSEEADGRHSVGVPYIVDVDIEEIPALEWAQKERWMDRVLATAAFGMSFRCEEFRVQSDASGEPPAVELPLAVARVLERFHLRDWLLSTQIDVSRQPPTLDEAGELTPQEVTTIGQAYISDASGTYENFRYPLKDVSAHLTFDNHQVKVDYLAGQSVSGGSLRLTGTIAPPTNAAAISLALTARGIAVDKHLRGALREGQQKVFDALLHRASADALARAGLVTSEADVVVAQERRRAAAARRAELRESAEDGGVASAKEDARLTGAITRAQNLMDAGPFSLGGRIDLDLQIKRPEGRGKRVRTTGRVTIRKLGAVYEKFPYPLQVIGGVLDWREDAVVILEDDDGSGGLRLVAPGGGGGRLTGRIDLEREGRVTRLRPDLTLRIVGDEVNPALYAAIPPMPGERDAEDAVARGWPGTALTRSARWLKELDLEGELDFTAHITTDDDRRLDYTVDIDIVRGAADPSPAMAEVLGGEGLLDTADWYMSDCRGSVTVHRGGIELENLTGRHRRGRVGVSGTVDLRATPADLDLQVALRETEVGDYLIRLLPESQAAQAEALWRRYRPHGKFDADLAYRRRGGETEPLSLHVRPGPQHVMLGDAAMVLTPTAGELVVSRALVKLQDLVIHVADGSRDDGVLTLDGRYALGVDPAPQRTELRGGWTDGHLQSPLIGEALRLLDAGETARRYLEHKPKGPFSSEFSYTAGRGADPARYTLRVWPKTIALEIGGEAVSYDVHEGSEIAFEDGLIELKAITADAGEGLLEVSGAIAISPRVEVKLAIDYEGRVLSGGAGVLVPQAVKSVLQTIDYDEGEGSAVRGATLRAARVSEGEATGWEVDFAGEVEVHDASLRAGLTFSDVRGPAEVMVLHRPGELATVEIQARPETARAMGQDLRDISADIRLSESGTAVLLENFRARAGDGAVTAGASVELAEHGRYEVSARLAEVPLSDFLIREPGTPAEAPGEETEAPSGHLFASVDLAGRLGRPESRRGRGSGRVWQGDLARIPMVLQVMNLLQFSSPAGNLNYAEVEYFIDGDRAVFERVLLESTQGELVLLELRGVGEMNLKTFDIDGRFHSRSAIAVVRDVVGQLGDQLVAIELTGPLWDPKARFVALPGISKPVSGIVGVAPRSDAEAQ